MEVEHKNKIKLQRKYSRPEIVYTSFIQEHSPNLMTEKELLLYGADNKKWVDPPKLEKEPNIAPKNATLCNTQNKMLMEYK